MEEEKIETTRNVDLDRFLEDLKAVVRDGQQLLQASMTGIKTRAADGIRTTEQSVRDHPGRSLGMVFGMGVLVGLLAAGMLSGDGKHD